MSNQIIAACDPTMVQIANLNQSLLREHEQSSTVGSNFVCYMFYFSIGNVVHLWTAGAELIRVEQF